MDNMVFVHPESVRKAVQDVMDGVFSDYEAKVDAKRKELLELISLNIGLMTGKQIAAWFGKSDRTIYRWHTQYGCPVVDGPGKSYMFDPKAVADWYKQYADSLPEDED